MANLAQAEVDRELYSKEMEEDDLGMRLLSMTVASIHHHQYHYIGRVKGEGLTSCRY